ncbi:hypothetical protein D3C73_728640 [compost metagenome]
MGRLELFFSGLQHGEPHDHHHDTNDERSQPRRHEHAQGVDSGHQQDDEPRQQHDRTTGDTGNAGLQRREALLQLGLGQRQFLGEQRRHFASQLTQQADDRSVRLRGGHRSDARQVLIFSVHHSAPL